MQEGFSAVPSCVGESGGDVTVRSPRVDWSFQTRKKQKLLKLEPNQPKITDYISIPTKVQDILQHNSKELRDVDIDEDRALKFSTELFKKLIENAQNNFQKRGGTMKLLKAIPYLFCL